MLHLVHKTDICIQQTHTNELINKSWDDIMEIKDLLNGTNCNVQ